MKRIKAYFLLVVSTELALDDHSADSRLGESQLHLSRVNIFFNTAMMTFLSSGFFGLICGSGTPDSFQYRWCLTASSSIESLPGAFVAVWFCISTRNGVLGTAEIGGAGFQRAPRQRVAESWLQFPASHARNAFLPDVIRVDTSYWFSLFPNTYKKPKSTVTARG